EGSERTRLARGLPRWHSPDRESGCAQVSWTGSKRDCLIFLALPFVLSVAQGAKSKHERLFQHPARGTASLSHASCHVARSIGQWVPPCKIIAVFGTPLPEATKATSASFTWLIA